MAKEAGIGAGWWPHRSYRAKLTMAFCGVAFIGLVIMGTVYYYKMSLGIEQNTRANLQKLADRTVSMMELHMDNISNEAWRLFSDKDFQIYVDNMNSGFPEKDSYYRIKIEMILRKNERIGLLAVYDLQGNRNHAGKLWTRGARDERTEREEELAIEQALQEEGAGVWRLAKLDTAGTDYALSYVQAIKKISTYSQKMVGVLRIDLGGSAFEKLMRDLGPSKGNDFYVATRDGLILQATERQRINTDMRELPWYKPGSYNAQAGVEMIEVAGKPYMTVYQYFSEQDWMLIGSIPLASIMGEVRDAQQFTLWVGGLCLLAAALCAYFISGGVTKPLRQLRERMKQVEMGNFKVSVPIHSLDEIGVIGVRFNRMTREIDHLVDKIYEVELLRKDAEIQALQLQINPHFLYNSLEMIDSVAEIEGQALISQVAQSLAGMFRYSISGGKFATLGEEIQHIRLYLQIQQIRYEDRFTYSIEIDPELLEFRLPKLLLQPLVENAMKHSIEQQPDGGHIGVAACKAPEGEGWVRITVRDNGWISDAARLQMIEAMLQDRGLYTRRLQQERVSIGLDNINRRIRLHYGDRAELVLTSSAQAGTEASLLIPAPSDGIEEEATDGASRDDCG